MWEAEGACGEVFHGDATVQPGLLVAKCAEPLCVLEKGHPVGGMVYRNLELYLVPIRRLADGEGGRAIIFECSESTEEWSGGGPRALG